MGSACDQDWRGLSLANLFLSVPCKLMVLSIYGRNVMCTDPICHDAECKAEYYRWLHNNDVADFYTEGDE